MSSVTTTRSPVRLGGYQGPASVMTQALTQLAQQLGALQPEPLDCALDADVLALGETARALFDGIEAGERQICYMASGYLSARVPELAVLDLPFSVRERARALEALDGTVGAALTAAVERATGLAVLGFWDNGFRHVSNGRHPIRAPADCAGLKIRTLDSADYRATMQALGFEAVTTDVRELLRAVETGAVDAQENPLTNLVLFGLWRQHRFVSLTGHLFGIALLVAERAWLHGLTPPQQQAVHDAAREATLLQRRLAAAEDDSALAFLQHEQVQIVAPPELDIAAMRRSCAALVDARRAQLPQALCDAYIQ